MPPISDGQVIFPPNPYETFNIGICLSDTTSDGYSYVNGFEEVLNTLGQKHNYEFNYKIINGSSLAGIRFAVSQLVSDGCDLIYSIGPDALSTSLLFAPSTPIVMAGVIDFTDFMYTDLDGELTRNFTGVSSLPNTELLLSTLIEATDKIDGVGLLYSQDDTQSVYQMQRLEQLLNQAKIPWKEYALDMSTETPITEDAEETDTEADTEADKDLPKTKVVRIPLRSLNWMRNPKVAPVDIGSLKEELDDFSRILNMATDECSALFIPSKSLVCTRAEEISEIAIQKAITTVTNDSTIGKNTLVSIYSNPYHQGRIAGAKAYEILINKKNVQEIPISEISLEKSQKLYSRHFANIVEKDFPKSFREVSTFNFSQK